MLRLWPDQVLLVLHPSHIAMLRLRGWPGRRRVVAKHTQDVPVREDGQRLWEPVLAALETCLAKAAWQQAHAKIVVSDAFVRYLLLPWNPALLSAEEQQKLVQFKMQALYGKDKTAWQMALAPAVYGQDRLVCALDADMLSALKKLTAQHQLKLRSLQPHLVAALNFWKRQFRNQPVQFMLAGPEKHTLVYIAGNQMKRVRTELGQGALTAASVQQVMQRERLLHEGIAATAKRLLFAPSQAALHTQELQALHLQQLKLPPGAVNDAEAFLAAGGFC